MLSADSGRLRMMLLMLSLKSRRRLEQGLGVPRGTCCSFRVSPETVINKNRTDVMLINKTENTKCARIIIFYKELNELLRGC